MPQDLNNINQDIKKLKLYLNEIWHFYSITEIKTKFPNFFQLKIIKRLPAQAALEYVEKGKRQEIKRLVAIKTETVVANAMRTKFEGFNQVAYKA